VYVCGAPNRCTIQAHCEEKAERNLLVVLAPDKQKLSHANSDTRRAGREDRVEVPWKDVICSLLYCMTRAELRRAVLLFA
jgi:hypothetical protein